MALFPLKSPEAQEHGEEQLRDTSELQFRKDFESLLLSLSTRFIRLPYEQLDRGLDSALESVGRFTQVDRCFIYQIDENDETASLTHEWRREGTPKIQEHLQHVPTEPFQWVISELAAGHTLVFEDTAAMPKEAAALAAMYDRFSVRSAVGVPLMPSGGSLRGMLGLSTTHSRRAWPEEYVAIIKVLAEMLSSVVERHTARSALARSEERFRNIIRDQTEMILRWSPAGNVSFANDAALQFFGASPDRLESLNYLARVCPEDRVRLQETLATLTPKSPHRVDERQMVRPNGQVVWGQWIDRGLFDASGDLIEYQSVGRDVTRLRTAQKELDQRLRFEQLVVGLSMRMINPPPSDRDQALRQALREIGEFTDVDRSYVFLFDPSFQHAELTHYWSAPGCPPINEDVRVVRLQDFHWSIYPLFAGEPIHVPTLDALPSSAAHWKKRLKVQGIKSYINVPMISRNRVVGYLGFSCYREEHFWTEDEIALLRLVGEILVNTIERGWSEIALEKSRERLRLTIEGVEEGVYDWNVESGNVAVSDYWLRMLGMPPGANVQSYDAWRDMVHPEDWAQAREKLDHHFAGRTPVFEAEYRMRHTEGHYLWMLDRGRVVERSDSGGPRRMLGVNRDITQAIVERNQRQQLQSQLAQLGRVAAMGETVAGIAHEIIQPLHAASTFNAASLRALASGNRDKAIKLIGKASDQIARAGDIIKRLREFTRPRPAEIQPVDLNALLEETASFVLSFNRSTPVTLHVALDRSLPSVEGDRVQLQQVVVNLIQNAIDAIQVSEQGCGRIELRTAEQDGLAVVAVSDNGAGCRLPDPDRVFEAFVSTKDDGMGIGLSLCRTIVEQHQGVILAQSNQAGGMTFTVRLPIPGGGPE